MLNKNIQEQEQLNTNKEVQYNLQSILILSEDIKRLQKDREKKIGVLKLKIEGHKRSLHSFLDNLYKQIN